MQPIDLAGAVVLGEQEEERAATSGRRRRWLNSIQGRLSTSGNSTGSTDGPALLPGVVVVQSNVALLVCTTSRTMLVETLLAGEVGSCIHTFLAMQWTQYPVICTVYDCSGPKTNFVMDSYELQE